MAVTVDDALVVAGVLLLKSMLSSHPHSGQSTPPLFGDYEAQRHWQEITLNLPAGQWYENSTVNDLQYWGLDYPPLTAYHSYAMGVVAEKVNPEFVALRKSRGMESEEHRSFMRMTVLAADVAVWIPAALFFAKTFHPENAKHSALTLALITVYPGLILIDNGHFQYNNISLGLFVAAVAFLARKSVNLGSVFFCLALNYKQMELYHALPFFFYLLGLCWKERSVTKLAGIGITVIATMALVWLPFVGSVDSATQVVRRIFPFARGVFEDKVANFWCTLNNVVKIKAILDIPTMAMVSLATTFTLSLISNLHLLFKPSINNFVLALVNTSFVFYLFSFQVHEKSILLVAVPVSLFAGGIAKFNSAGAYGRYSSIISVWFLNMSTFSMHPLLLRDGLALPLLSLSTFFTVGCVSTGYLNPTVGLLDQTSDGSGLRRSPRNRVPRVEKPDWRDDLVWWVFLASMAGCAALLLASAFLSPPARLPDIHPVMISAYSAVHFIAFAAYFHYIQWTGGSPMATELKKTN